MSSSTLVTSVDLPFNILTKGGQAILLKEEKWKEFEGNRELGTKYTVVLPAAAYEKLTVKIPSGSVITQAEIDSATAPITVDFTDFHSKIYCVNGNMGITATASAINIDRKGSKPTEK